MDVWRDTRHGIEYLHQPTNLLITGAIDDVWINSQDELIIVDYKATAKGGEVSLDAEWQKGYKRQMEVYQWLFKKMDSKFHRLAILFTATEMLASLTLIKSWSLTLKLFLTLVMILG